MIKKIGESTFWYFKKFKSVADCFYNREMLMEKISWDLMILNNIFYMIKWMFFGTKAYTKGGDLLNMHHCFQNHFYLKSVVLSRFFLCLEFIVHYKSFQLPKTRLKQHKWFLKAFPKNLSIKILGKLILI